MGVPELSLVTPLAAVIPTRKTASDVATVLPLPITGDLLTMVVVTTIMMALVSVVREVLAALVDLAITVHLVTVALVGDHICLRDRLSQHNRNVAVDFAWLNI